MNWNTHYNLEGKHAFLGASNYYWLGYDMDKLISVWRAKQAVLRGTRLHGIAKDLISERIKLPRSKQTLNTYVNDAIGFHMRPEQVLCYSDNCFGTTDAIAYNESQRLLRIHDLKTGATPASMKQLLIYMAMFCLEYDIDPSKIDAELRIYQNDEIDILNPSTDDIMPVMDTMMAADDCITQLRAEVRD